MIITYWGYFSKLKQIHLTIKQLANLEFLSKSELFLIFVQTILLIILSIPYILGRTKVYLLLIFVIISLSKAIIFSFRRASSNYSMKYHFIITLYSAQILTIFIAFFFLPAFETYTILANIFSIIFLLIFCIIGFLNLSMSIKYSFYWRLKKLFPSHGEPDHAVDIKLKNLAPFLSVDKQGAYLLIHYGIHITVYGYYIFLCLFAFKLTDFSAWPFFNLLHSHIQSWAFLNISNTIGLLSIFLAILTICLPAQQKIINEAEKKYYMQYNKF